MNHQIAIGGAVLALCAAGAGSCQAPARDGTTVATGVKLSANAKTVIAALHAYDACSIRLITSPRDDPYRDVRRSSQRSALHQLDLLNGLSTVDLRAAITEAVKPGGMSIRDRIDLMTYIYVIDRYAFAVPEGAGSNDQNGAPGSTDTLWSLAPDGRGRLKLVGRPQLHTGPYYALLYEFDQFAKTYPRRHLPWR